jgi:hypothetical protein
MKSLIGSSRRLARALVQRQAVALSDLDHGSLVEAFSHVVCIDSADLGEPARHNAFASPAVAMSRPIRWTPEHTAPPCGDR